MKPGDFTCPQSGLTRNWICERKADARRVSFSDLADAALRARIGRICARYELEPDEFQTAEQKAARYL